MAYTWKVIGCKFRPQADFCFMPVQFLSIPCRKKGTIARKQFTASCFHVRAFPLCLPGTAPSLPNPFMRVTSPYLNKDRNSAPHLTHVLSGIVTSTYLNGNAAPRLANMLLGVVTATYLNHWKKSVPSLAKILIGVVTSKYLCKGEESGPTLADVLLRRKPATLQESYIRLGAYAIC